MLDVRDELVIDLYPLTVEMRHGIKPPTVNVSGRFMRKRDLFVEIRDHHLARLTRTYVAPQSKDPYLAGVIARSRADAFARLPTCTTDSPTAAEVVELCERVRVQLVPLGDDRNKNRAHALEGEAEAVAMHSMPMLDDLFEYVEGVIEDLSLVSEGSSFGRQDLNNAGGKETAADMVDLILLGNISDLRRLTAKRTREQLYARLHEIHDNPPPPEPGDKHTGLFFNDRQYAEPIEDIVEFFATGGVRAANPA